MGPGASGCRVCGPALLALLSGSGGIGPTVLVFGRLGLPTVCARVRTDSDPYYQAVPVPARWAMGAAWLVLAVFLGFASYQAHNQLLSYLG